MYGTANQGISLYTPTGLRKYLARDERQGFMDAAGHLPPKLRLLCLTLAYSGCRISEALDVRIGTIHPASGYLPIHCLKKRRKGIFRAVPVPTFLLEDIAALHADDNKPSDARVWGWSRGRAWYLVKEVMLRAGIAPGPHCMPKGLRHGYAIEALRRDISLNLVQRWMGHASLTTTAIYLEIAVGDEEREIAARMWRPWPSHHHAR